MAKNRWINLTLLAAKELFKYIFKQKSPTTPSKEAEEKIHPWRMCPIGEHWVKEHDLTIPPSPRMPDGGMTIRRGHCARNPNRNKKNETYMTSLEMDEIADRYFKQLNGPPNSSITYKWNEPMKNDYDHFIRGWTKYWNEVLKPEPPLDPDFVKALIASESSFNKDVESKNAGTAGKAHGLLQLTDQTIKAIGDEEGELKEHLIEFELKDAQDPNKSINAGIRWLHHKKKIASRKLKKNATWLEGTAEYKGYSKELQKGTYKETKGIKKIEENYEIIKSYEKDKT